MGEIKRKVEPEKDGQKWRIKEEGGACVSE